MCVSVGVGVGVGVCDCLHPPPSLQTLCERVRVRGLSCVSGMVLCNLEHGAGMPRQTVEWIAY